MAPQAKDFVSASSEKQQAFSSALNENEKKQDEQWAAVKTSLTQIGELQEKRIALIQDRLGQVWTLKREEKVRVGDGCCGTAGLHPRNSVRLHVEDLSR